MTGRATATAVALASAALGAAGCGGDRVDRKDLEQKIADFVHRQTGTTIDVHCPDGVTPDKGTRVTCTTVLSGAETDIGILFTDKGKFRITTTRVKMG